VIIPTGEQTWLGFRKKDRHVMALRRGENRFLVHLENYLKHQTVHIDGVKYEARP
jgi:hypothetical protein